MTDFFKTLLNIRSLRVALRDMPLDQVCEAKEKFDLVFAELQEAAEQERAAGLVAQFQSRTAVSQAPISLS